MASAHLGVVVVVVARGGDFAVVVGVIVVTLHAENFVEIAVQREQNLLSQQILHF